jgi:dipeptidyl aminopeptidase/acylaminoacyl peptidase
MQILSRHAGRVLIAFILILGPAARAQTPAPFTADDILKVASVNVLDVAEDGSRVAVSVRRPYDNETTDHRRYGDPTYLPPNRVRLQVIETATGAAATPFKDLINVRDAAWSRDGKRLAILVATEVDSIPAASLFVWDADRRTLAEVKPRPAQSIAVNSNLSWTPDGIAIVATARDPKIDREARESFRSLTEGPIIVHKSSDPFLEWDLLSRSARARSIVAIDATSGAVRTILPETKLTSYQFARDGSFLTVMEDATQKTDYDTIGGSENVLKRIDARSGEAKVVLDAKELKGLTLRWSDDGRTFAYAKRGEVFVQDVDGSKPRSLTPKPQKPAEAEKEPAPPSDPAKPEEESFTPVSFSRDAAKLLVTSKRGWYVIGVADAARTLVLPLDEDEEKNPRVTAIDWTPDGGGIYASWSARSRWERGIVRIDIATGTVTPVRRDTSLYGSPRLSRDGSTFVFTMSDGDRPSDLYAADARFNSVKRLTDANPWISPKLVPKSELVAYRDTDGKPLYGVLRYPVNYEKGRTYPTIFEVYETFFDNGFNARAAFLTNHGYAVFMPSVNLVVGRPGEAWVKGVTAAANRLIDMGVADPERLGVHGTSYGGYATALLITQTDRFKAAINISGKVDMVSFYTDSPRLGVRNTHAPEKSQDRIGGTLWEYPERYLEHSAILRADRIKTPLLNITGDQDPNVPSSQSREMYYAMRRLGKEVEWVRYVNGGHRPPNSNAESVDFEQRILGWYDKYLKKPRGSVGS